MTKAAALYQFFSSFGIPAYEESSVPTNEDGGAPSFPYITYEVITGSFGEEVALSFSAWYKSTSWTEANQMEETISKRIGRGGIYLLCDGGVIWIKRGTPWAQRTGDDSHTSIKRIIMNLSVEFWTED